MGIKEQLQQNLREFKQLANQMVSNVAEGDRLFRLSFDNDEDIGSWETDFIAASEDLLQKLMYYGIE